MKQSGTTVWINTPLDTLFERLVNEKDKRPLIKDLSGEQLKGFIAVSYTHLTLPTSDLV